MKDDTELFNLCRKLKTARRKGGPVADIIGRICRARAKGLTGLIIQVMVLCQIVEAGADRRAVRLARNMRQTIMTLLKEPPD